MPARYGSTRYSYNLAGCTSTFRRQPDLARHVKSIHGPKTPCPQGNCGYATGREDKMKEHVHKNHKCPSQYDTLL